MILPTASRQDPETKTITLADGQTLDVLVARPTFQQRFNDEGRELAAYSGRQPDAWSELRMGRIRDVVVDWKNVTNDKQQPVPFSMQRLLQLMEAAPEVVEQLVSLSTEAFRPLVPASLKSDGKPATSGERTRSRKRTPKPETSSDSTSNSDEPANSLDQSESAPPS